MDRVDLLFQRTAVQYDKPVDRTCSPIFAIPLDALMDRYLPERTTPLPDFGSLHVRAPLSGEAAQAMIEALLQAESVLIRVAGDLRSFVDWSSQTFQNHPGLEFSLPVACRLLGEDAEAKSYIDAYRARIQATGNRGYSDLYERYIEELARDFSAGA